MVKDQSEIKKASPELSSRGWVIKYLSLAVVCFLITSFQIGVPESSEALEALINLTQTPQMTAPPPEMTHLPPTPTAELPETAEPEIVVREERDPENWFLDRLEQDFAMIETGGFLLSEQDESVQNRISLMLALQILSQGAKQPNQYSETELRELLTSAGVGQEEGDTMPEHMVEFFADNLMQCGDVAALDRYYQVDRNTPLVPFLRGATSAQLFENIMREYRSQVKTEAYSTGFALNIANAKVHYLETVLPGIEDLHPNETIVINGEVGHTMLVIAIDKEYRNPETQQIETRALIVNGNLRLLPETNEKGQDFESNGDVIIEWFNEEMLAKLFKVTGAVPSGVVGLEQMER